jgi:hypothetical protein
MIVIGGAPQGDPPHSNRIYNVKTIFPLSFDETALAIFQQPMGGGRLG